MPFNGTGTFNRVYSWVTDQAAGILVRADRTDTDTNDIAAGLSNCMTRDGQSPPTAAIPMGGQKLTGLGNGSVTADALAWGQLFSGTVDLSGIVEFKVPATVNASDASTKTYADTKGAITGQTWTGTHSFTGATITVPTATAGDNSTKAASTAYVIAAAFSSALPYQVGLVNASIRSKGAGTAAWYEDSFTTLTTAGTLIAWNPYRFNTSAQTYLLPASPTDGDECMLANAGTNVDNVISGNGHNIVGPYASAATFTMDVAYAVYRVKYDATSTVWRAF